MVVPFLRRGRNHAQMPPQAVEETVEHVEKRHYWCGVSTQLATSGWPLLELPVPGTCLVMGSLTSRRTQKVRLFLWFI